MKEKLWTKNFTLMFTGNIISALGSVGLNIALGVIIYDNTQSTLMSSLFVAIMTVPNLILPLLVGSFIDRNNPLKVLLKNEKVLLLMYCLLLIHSINFDFNYIIYIVAFSIISSLGVISEVSGQSVTAQLMNPNVMSRGYAIMSTIYPLCNVIVAPIALVIYKAYGFSLIILLYVLLSLADIIIESNIKHSFTFNDSDSITVKQIIDDMKIGLNYIKDYTPLRSVFIFFTIVIISSGFSTLTYPFFYGSDTLTIEGYALLTSLNSFGYMLGGFFHSFVNIPDKFRYHIALVIYFIFIVFDATFLLVPFTMMLVMKFILGLAGMNSANIRNTAVQSSIANEQRGKVNGVFSMLMGFAGIVGNMLFGVLGEYFYIPYVFVFAQVLYLLGVVFIYLNPKNGIKDFYNLKLTNKATIQDNITS